MKGLEKHGGIHGQGIQPFLEDTRNPLEGSEQEHSRCGFVI